MNHSLCMHAAGRNRPSQRTVVVSPPSTRVMRAYMSRRNLLLNRWTSKDRAHRRSSRSHPLNNKIRAFNCHLFQANKRCNERNRENGCASSERRSGRKRPSSRPRSCCKGATWIPFNSTNKAETSKWWKLWVRVEYSSLAKGQDSLAVLCPTSLFKTSFNIQKSNKISI